MSIQQVVRWRFTDRDDGDLCVELPEAQLRPRRTAIAPGGWTWLRQVHGTDVIRVLHPGANAGLTADAAVTSAPGAVLAVHTADCAGVLFHGSGPEGVVIGAAHAGWRGLVAGVLQETVSTMRSLGAQDVTWRLGPCISPERYEFGEPELGELVRRYGPTLRRSTATGAPALDLRAGVRAALAEVEASEHEPATPVPCTSDESFFSWRTRRDTGRQAAVTWIEAA